MNAPLKGLTPTLTTWILPCGYTETCTSFTEVEREHAERYMRARGFEPTLSRTPVSTPEPMGARP